MKKIHVFSILLAAMATGAAPGYAQNATYYNQNAQPFSMEQMIAGRNAPSYDFNRTAQPYMFNNSAAQSYSYQPGGVLTPQQAMQMRAQRDAEAQRYQQEYMQKLQANQAANRQNPAIGAPYAVQGQQNAAQVQPRKRRVVYRENDNPLAAPPRLFNPDQ